MELREKMKPYITEIMKEAHEKGTPVMRPLFYDFPEDKICWETEDAYMFGPNLLVAPILHEKERQRRVYLPEGMWHSIHDNREYRGGQVIDVQAPLDEIPVFARNGKLW